MTSERFVDPRARVVRLRPGQRLEDRTGSPASARAEAEDRRRIEAMMAAGDYFHTNSEGIVALLGGDPMAADTLRMDTAPALTELVGKITAARLPVGEIVRAIHDELMTTTGAENPRQLSAISRRYGGFLQDSIDSIIEQRRAQTSG